MENIERSGKKGKPKVGIEIDIKKMDEQLRRHIDKTLRLRNKKSCDDDDEKSNIKVSSVEEKWEIDPNKLLLKSKIQGAFGSVYRGVYDGVDVAVKLMDLGDGIRRNFFHKTFSQEVSIWNKMDHPNIVKLIGAKASITEVNMTSDCNKIDKLQNICCIVVEYLIGGTLKSYLIRNRKKKLPLKVVIRLALDIAKGLCYMHYLKLVHRDVKTENMLLDKDGRVKITDFGVSRVEAKNYAEMTRRTGTLGYMAPEVFMGNAYDHKCDVYSFGICLWEIYCCSMPYPYLASIEETSSVVYKSSRPDIPKSCPDSVANVMKKCWDADPKKRPEMEEVIQMLEAIDVSKGGGMIQDDDQLQSCFCLLRRQRR
ncbi:serine threonine- kinase HT1-like [Olea europaea subsp. europaea]|uniref:Serine threonine- kinase HT1-like n=1 Tax=Olea europaea subsp. europaea TaxID=158383 RepID=A0A8S0QS92_OLEEU|nr:serine threonine- kinase HT1-like [Olea europaea subsp. europaea]